MAVSRIPVRILVYIFAAIEWPILHNEARESERTSASEGIHAKMMSEYHCGLCNLGTLYTFRKADIRDTSVHDGGV